MKTIETVGGWTWYVRQVKENSKTPITDYKELMKKYMVGIHWETVVKEMNK